jgi:hypothetical protein
MGVMKKGLKIIGWVALGLLGVFAFGWVVMQLWNWLIPVLFGGPTLTFWQAMGLLLLSKLLLGFGGKGGWHHHRREHWRAKYDKFSSMSPEERAALKEKMKEKWCRWDENTSGKDSPASNG